MKPTRGSFVTGLVVGLLIGLSVALGVALYITKAPVPFINKVPQRGAEQDAAEAERNKNWDPNAPLAGKNPARPAAVTAAPALPPAAAPPNTPIVPSAGVDSAAAGAATRSPPRPAAAAANGGANPSAGPSAGPAARPPRDPATILAGQPDPAGPAPAVRADTKPASATVPSFFVQAGAYARSEDAETQRAKLALLDLAARITEREQSGRTVFRVRLGPFEARSDAEDAQGKLAAAGIDANLVRVER